MTFGVKLLKLAALICVQLILSHASAALFPLRWPAATEATKKQELILKRRIDFSHGIDASSIQPVESPRALRTEDISKIIPANDLQPTNDGGLVATKILSHSLANWLNSEAVRNSSIGQAAHQLDEKLEGDLSFKGNEPNAIRHSLKFSMKAAQTRADLEYTGITKAQVSYFIAQATTNVEIREEIEFLGSEFVFNHHTSPTDTRRTVSLRWNW